MAGRALSHGSGSLSAAEVNAVFMAAAGGSRGGRAGFFGFLCTKITFWPDSGVRSEPSGEAEGFPGGVCGRAVLVAYHVVDDAGARLLAGEVGRGVEVPHNRS